MQGERKFGDIPDWAKEGPISLRNYSARAELHCKTNGPGRANAHPTIKLGSPECEVWRRYFLARLGGYPRAMQMLLDGGIKEMTVPEALPQWFDPSYEPEAVRYLPAAPPAASRPIARAPIPEGADYYSMTAKHGVPVSRETPAGPTRRLSELIEELEGRFPPIARAAE